MGKSEGWKQAHTLAGVFGKVWYGTSIHPWTLATCHGWVAKYKYNAVRSHGAGGEVCARTVQGNGTRKGNVHNHHHERGKSAKSGGANMAYLRGGAS